MLPHDTARLWDSTESVRRYRAFSRRHSRYREANAELVRRAALRPGLTVLDLGAGLGGTARAALAAMGGEGRVICVEPAGAMRAAGTRSLARATVEWCAEIPADCRVDRILCGAALWQLTPLEEHLARLRSHLRPGGAFCFNIPALYLREPDPPGEGRDPHLLELTGRLREGAPPCSPPPSWVPPPDRQGLEAILTAAGFHFETWEFSLRLTQAAWRDWLKLPPCSAPMLPGLSDGDRAARIDAVFAECDPASWRWERWRGWTAWVE
jgi:SAM-dependent methyltransferase